MSAADQAEGTPGEPGGEDAALVLEYALPPGAAAGLTRHPAITAARAGRSRSRPEELRWLDTANERLAATGLVLEMADREPPHLLRLLPSADRPWLPGTPPEVVPAGDEAATAASSGLAPFAAFSGRCTVLRLDGPGGPVAVTLRLGKLRTVADERPVARLRLAGPAGPVLALGERLAADRPLLPPAAALPEEGRAMARGGMPHPRRRGPPDLHGAATVDEALAVAMGHLLEIMLYQAPHCDLGAGPDGVHQLRVALRRLRSVLRAFRPAADGPELRAFDAGLRRLAGLLGPARDWDVFLGGLGAACGAAFGTDRRMAALLRAATVRRDAAYAALRSDLDGPRFRSLILAGQRLIVERPWHAAPGEDAEQAAPGAALDAFAVRLLEKRWRRLQADGEDFAALDAAALHELRLHGKRLRYVAELFAPLWPGRPARRFLKRLAALQEALGEANDLAMARTLVAGLGPSVPAWALGAAEGFALGRAARTRRDAGRAWRRMAGTKAFWPED